MSILDMLEPLTPDEIERRREDAIARQRERENQPPQPEPDGNWRKQHRKKLRALRRHNSSVPQRTVNGRRQFFWRGKWRDE